MSDLRGPEPGNTVRVIYGPFAGDTASVLSVDHERGRVRVSVLIFGDTATADVSLSDIEPLG